MEHDDTVSLKCKGGEHSTSKPNDGKCYIFLYPTQGSSKPTLQKEWPHPKIYDVNPKADCWIYMGQQIFLLQKKTITKKTLLL